MPGAEPVGAEHHVHRGHFRQRRSEELPELPWAEEVLEVRRTAIRQGRDEGRHGSRVRQLQSDVDMNICRGRQRSERG